MVAGSAGVAVCLFALAWMEDIVGIFVGNAELRKSLTIVAAVVDIYILDFVINAVQAACRSLVVDTLPVQKQHLGSAWVSRVAGLGHLLVYGIGSLDLVGMLGTTFLGNTQFKKVCVIAALALIVSQGITCYSVEERALVINGKIGRERKTAYTILRDIWNTTLRLPPKIRAICWVTFWSWIGWFPFLFYSSTWVGEIYLRYNAPKTGASGRPDALSEVGRVGSTSLVVFSLVSFTISVVVPYLAKSAEDETSFQLRGHKSKVRDSKSIISWSKPSIAQLWTIANIFFAVSMIWAPSVRSVGFATLLVALCGIPWAIGGWASFALIGAEINKLSATIPQHNSRNANLHHRVSEDDISLERLSRPGSPHALHLRHDSNASTNSNDGQTGELAGIYLGILNLYTTLPQFIGTGISTVVFSILEPGKSPELTHSTASGDLSHQEGLSGIAVCLFIGALCAGIAAWKCRDLNRD